MVFTFDPVGSGFIASLARPGGNITGLSADASSELWAKYLAFLRELLPSLSRVGVIGQVSAQAGFSELEAASRKLGLTLDIADIKAPEDLDGAMTALVAKRVGAVFIVSGRRARKRRSSIAFPPCPTRSNTRRRARC